MLFQPFKLVIQSPVEMTCIRSVLFVIMVLNFLDLGYSNLQGTAGNPRTKENVKCIMNPSKEENVSNYPDIAKADAETRNKSIPKNVPVGENFTYEACGNNSEMILKWGLHKHGNWPPKLLLARVETNDTLCSVDLTPEFKASRYHGRLTVEYNISWKCVLWTLSNVTQEDENAFIAAVRDDFSQGKDFVGRTPVFLSVSTEAATPLPTTRPPETTAVETEGLTPTPLPTTPPPETTAVETEGLSSPTPTKTSTTPSTTPTSILTPEWVAIGLTVFFAFIIGAIACWRCCKNLGPRSGEGPRSGGGSPVVIQMSQTPGTGNNEGNTSARDVNPAEPSVVADGAGYTEHGSTQSGREAEEISPTRKTCRQRKIKP